MASKPVRFVRGVVRQEPTGAFLEGVTVVARFRPGSSAAERTREAIGRGPSDKDGAFRIALHPSLFGENARPGTIEFAVEKDGLPVPLAGQTTWSYDPRRLPGDIVLCVAERHECSFSEEPPNPSVSSGERSVRGIVRHEDGSPIDGLKIEVVRVQLGALAPQTPTDLTGAKGDYGVVLTDDANPWHIFIRAYIVGTPDEEVGASSVLSNAPIEARIDLEIADDRLRSKSRYKGLLEQRGVSIQQARERVAEVEAFRTELPPEWRAQRGQSEGLDYFLDVMSDPSNWQMLVAAMNDPDQQRILTTTDSMVHMMRLGDVAAWSQAHPSIAPTAGGLQGGRGHRPLSADAFAGHGSAYALYQHLRFEYAAWGRLNAHQQDLLGLSSGPSDVEGTDRTIPLWLRMGFR